MDGTGRTSRPQVPWGFLGLIVLVVAIEWCVVGDSTNFGSDLAVSWGYSGRIVGSRARDKDILCFGDSMVKFGLLPRVIGAHLGKRVYNFALSAGSAPSSYFLLRRALRAKSRPSLIVVDFARDFLGAHPTSGPKALPWADLLTLREAAELSWVASDPDVLASIVVQQALPSARARHAIRSNILAALKGEPNDWSTVVLVHWRNWNVNGGSQVNPKGKPFPDEAIPAGEPPGRGDWSCHPIHAHYVRRFLDLAQRHGITVCWLLPPVMPGTQSVWEYTGDEARYVEFVRQQQARSPHLVVIDGRHANYRPGVFVDRVHLDRDGAVALSLAVGEILKDGRTGPGTGRRWIRLPGFTAPPTDHAVEDLAQSFISIQDKRARIRR